MDRHLKVHTAGRRQAAIIMMGLTGSGKSTFIASLTGIKDRVGSSLQSYTRKAEAIYYDTDPSDHNRDLYLIDTPGFDDTTRSDLEIVREIGIALQVLMRLDIMVHGVIYLHRIIDPRVSGATIKSLRVLEQICGMEAYQNVTLVSTMWDRLEFTQGGNRIGDDRVFSLASKKEFWGNLIGGGAFAAKLGSEWTPRTIVERLVVESNRRPLQMQYELGGDATSLPLEKTSVGRYLERDINTVRKQYENELNALQDDLMEAIEDRDEKLQRLVLKEKETRKDLLNQINAQLWELQMKTSPSRQKGKDSITVGGGQTGNFAQRDSESLYAQQQQETILEPSYISSFDDKYQKEPYADISEGFLNNEFEALRQNYLHSSTEGHEIDQEGGNSQGTSDWPQSSAGGQGFKPGGDRLRSKINDSQSPTIRTSPTMRTDPRQRSYLDQPSIDRFEAMSMEDSRRPRDSRSHR